MSEIATCLMENDYDWQEHIQRVVEKWNKKIGVNLGYTIEIVETLDSFESIEKWLKSDLNEFKLVINGGFLTEKDKNAIHSYPTSLAKALENIDDIRKKITDIKIIGVSVDAINHKCDQSSNKEDALEGFLEILTRVVKSIIESREKQDCPQN